jgi:hypothetical protein
MSQAKRTDNMAAKEDFTHIQLHRLDLLQDVFNERKRGGSEEREKNEIILTNERTNATICKSVPPTTSKFIIRFHSR